MTGYLLNFIFYTLAMIGVILLGYVIAKKSLMGINSSNSKAKFLSIESNLAIEPRKTIYVLKAGNERFLMSVNADQTQLLTKLDAENIPTEENYAAENKNMDLNSALSNITCPNTTILNLAKKLNLLITPKSLKR